MIGTELSMQGKTEAVMNLKKRLAGTVILTGLLALATGLNLTLIPEAYAQETAARISGTVSDSSGAAVPAAKLTIFNEERKTVSIAVTSDEDGNFSVQQLQPGSYTITVEANGFRKTALSNVQLSVAQRLDLPISLIIGSASETVEVSASTQPQIENGTATVSTLITPSELKDLPLPNRDVTSLISLVPGAVHGGGATNVNAAQVSINGSRTLNTEVLLDGSSVLIGSTGNISRLPSPDFLSEFRVISSNAAAEYGRTSGAVITIGTRAGTRKFHGGVYELFRNEGLNANTYFNKLNGVRRPINHYNQFGFTIGGPFFIPRVYDHRDRTFFFLNYDQTVSHTPGTATLTIPQAAFRGGDFSSSSVIIRDPNTNAPFPGNVIPSARIDPATRAILAAMPGPTTGTSANNYFTQQNLKLLAPRYSGRIDQTFSDATSVFLSVTRQILNTPQVVSLNPLLNPSYT